MSKPSKAGTVASYRPPPLPVEVLLAQAEEDAATPSCVCRAMNDILTLSLDRLHYLQLERVAERYVAQAAVRDLLSVIAWRTMPIDQGEGAYLNVDAGAAVDGVDQHRWTVEAEPAPCPIDRWARHVLPTASRPLTPAPTSPSTSASLDTTAPFTLVHSSPTSSFAHPSSTTTALSLPLRRSSATTRPSVSGRAASAEPSSRRTAAALVATPYSLPPVKPSTASEQQRLALLATFKAQQAVRAERQRRLREAQEEEERRRDEDRAMERALLSSRRMKADEKRSLQSSITRPPPPPPAKKPSLPSASPSAPPPTSAPRANAAAAPAPVKRLRRVKAAKADPSTVSTYTDASALMASIIRALQPAPGVRVLYASEVKLGGDALGGGGGGGGGAGNRGMRVDDEGWKAMVSRMTRSQYAQWIEKQREDIRLQQIVEAARTANAAQLPSAAASISPPSTAPAPLRLSAAGEEKEQLTMPATRTAVSVAAKALVSSEEKRALSFDSSIAVDEAWGIKGSAGGGSASPRKTELPIAVSHVVHSDKALRGAFVRRGRWAERNAAQAEKKDGVGHSRKDPMPRRPEGVVKVASPRKLAALFTPPSGEVRTPR